MIVAPRVIVDQVPAWITINGIAYRLKELPLPAEIKHLDNWSAWEPKPAKSGNGYFWNDAAAPDWEIRRRLNLSLRLSFVSI